MNNPQRIVLNSHLLMGFNQNSVITSSAFKSMIGGKGGGGGGGNLPPPSFSGDTGGNTLGGITITGSGSGPNNSGTITPPGNGDK